LVVDAGLSGIPWESLPSLRRQRMFRLPSLSALRARLELAATPMATEPEPKTTKRKAAAPKKSKAAAAPKPTGVLLPPSVKVHKTFYLLNPSGDLANTQVIPKARLILLHVVCLEFDENQFRWVKKRVDYVYFPPTYPEATLHW